jgi:hypothetical protein
MAQQEPAPSQAFLLQAEGRTKRSMETAQRLLDGGFWAAAVVWAVRSVEVFMKEFLLAPSYLPEEGGDWGKAVKKAGRLFGSSEWTKAFRRMDDLYGPIAPMLMEDGSDAHKYWRGPIIRFRGDIVHGAAEADRDTASNVISYGEQLILQLKLRMIVSGSHPLHREFMAAYEAAFKAYHGEGDKPA